MSESSFGFRQPDDYDRARTLLRESEFTEQGISQCTGLQLHTPVAMQLSRLVLPTNGGTPVEVLIKLFLIAEPVTREAATRALSPIPLDRWIEAGAISTTDDTVQPELSIVPFGDLYLVHDNRPRTGDAREDLVVGLGGSSNTLINSTIRRPVESVLDLGTGCGVQAFLAAGHSKQVTATDFNARAVDLAEFGRKLNGLGNVEMLHGDRFEPVSGRQFDLIITNPPFVISPESRFLFRDGSGHSRDEFVQQLVRTVPDYLAPGGYCLMPCNWAQIANQDWRARLQAWFEGLECEVWVMRGESANLDEYIRIWNKEIENQSSFGEVYRHWMAYFHEEKIESVGMGLITMRRGVHGRRSFRVDEAPSSNIGPIGEDIARSFEAFEYLNNVASDQQLLGRYLTIDQDVRFQVEFEPTDPSGWKTSSTRFVKTKGLGYVQDLSPSEARILQAWNETKSIRENLAQHHSIATSQSLQLIRTLVARGFLRPK